MTDDDLFSATIELARETLLCAEAVASRDPSSVRRVLGRVREFCWWARTNVCFKPPAGDVLGGIETHYAGRWLERFTREQPGDLSWHDCLCIALGLGWTVRWDENAALPFDVIFTHPREGGHLTALRLQSVCERKGQSEVEPFTEAQLADGAPCWHPFVGLYGVLADGTLEHIADRTNWSEASALATALWPEIVLPRVPPPYLA